MSDTQTLEGIKAAAPEGATHYHIGLQLYLRKGPRGYCGRWFRYETGHPGWPNAGKSDEWAEAGIASGEIIVLANIPADDMAESMPFELLEGDEEKPRSKYHREIAPGVWVDVYSVLVAFGVTNPADAHAVKKMLMPGKRGTKNAIQDRREAIQSLERAIEIEEQS